jgi:hypothetical protein
MNSVPKNKWLQPGFLIAVGILAVSAVGLNGAVAWLKLSFLKQPVPLKMELTTLPEQMGDWLQVSKDEPLDHELQETLGTDKYVFRDYVNVKVLDWMDLIRLGAKRGSDKDDSITAAVHSIFDGKGSHERKALVGALQAMRPDAVMNLAVTYYTGKVDTVAHIPERCYVADGYQPSETPETLLWDMGPGRLNGKPGEERPIAVRFLNFEDQTGAKRLTKRVAYFFFANGVYESDNLSVRQTLEDLRARHGFYSKVELMTSIPDHDQCAKVMSGFLTSVMPEVEKCYPDWNSVEHPGVKK